MGGEIKTQTFTLFTKLSVYIDERWCVCVCVWFDIGVALLCMCMWFQRATVTEYTLLFLCVFVCACSVSATPFELWNLCGMSLRVCVLSRFKVCLYNSFSSSGLTAAGDFWWLRCNPATSTETQPPPPRSQVSDVSESLLSRRLEVIHTATGEFQAEVAEGGVDDPL